MSVHNHGPAEGRGTLCPERRHPGGALLGQCMNPGLERRYFVQRVNDTSGKHSDCRYFVLDPTHDPLAVEALRTYSRAIRATNPTLADDLDAWIGQPARTARAKEPK